MSLRIVERILQRQGAGTQSKSILPKLSRASADVFQTGTPLDRIRLGASIGFDKMLADYVVAGSLGSLATLASARLSCRAYGRTVDNAFTIHRIYLQALNSTESRILQVITREGRLIDGETKLLQLLTEINPQTPEEWNLWFGGSNGHPPLLGGLSLKWQGNIIYQRAWGVDSEGKGPDKIEPKTSEESVYWDAFGEPETAASQGMLYYRKLGDKFYEYLNVAAIRSRNNGANERWIEAYVGLTINPRELDVISSG